MTEVVLPKKIQNSLTFSRRDFIKGAVSLAALPLLANCASAEKSSAGAENLLIFNGSDLIIRENEKHGTRDWMLTKTRTETVNKYRCSWIEGYCSHTSIRSGEKLSFFVSTNPVSSFRLDIYRMGYYGGTGGRHMMSLGPFAGVVQPDPQAGDERIRDTQWQSCAEITIPEDWLSGVYLGKLTAEREGWQSYVIFIVRDDRRADFLFQCSDTTWQAYNRWPSEFALYNNGKYRYFWGPGVEVSFNRPYGISGSDVVFGAPLTTGSGEFFLWEFPMAYWMEQHGYDVSYISNLDTHADPLGLLRAKGFLSVGHDEYYSMEMFDNLKNAINAGLNVAFFSGNTCFGKILLMPDAHGQPNRTFERVGVFAPPGSTRNFVEINMLEHEPPYANELVGAQTTGNVMGGADWICAQPDHWVFSGTGMRKGDGIPGLVGWEWHGDPALIKGLEILASGPTKDEFGKMQGVYTATIYPGPMGNFVFNASTCWWGDGLAEPPGYIRPTKYRGLRGPDVRCQRITKNILDRMRSLV